MKILIRTVSIILGLFVAALAFVFFSPDYNVYIVRSGSMAPALNIGDVVIAGHSGGVGGIKTGAIVTYEMGQGLITHRVISIAGNTMITKGDANEDPDSNIVQLSQVKGSYLFKIPYVGYLASFVRTRPGWFLVIVLPALLLAGLIVKDIIKEILKNEKSVKNTLKMDKPVNNMAKRNDPLRAILREASQGYNFPEMKMVDGKTKQKMTRSVIH